MSTNERSWAPPGPVVLALVAVLALAGGYLLGARQGLPDGVAAIVDGAPVPRARVAAIAAETHGDSADARDAITRAIDEALWLQAAWRAGYVQGHPDLRDALIADVQADVLARHPVATPTQAQLRALYAKAPERFRQLSGMRLQRWVFSPRRGGMRSAWSRATEAYRLLAAQGTGAVPAGAVPAGAVPAGVVALADADAAPLPDGVLTLADLRARVGGDMTILLAQLRTGELSRPVLRGDTIYVYRMLARDVAVVPPFEAVGARMSEEFMRQARERILLDELARLRARASIKVAPAGE